MAAGSTYTPISTTTLGSAASTVTFSSIAGTYTDIILVGDFSCSVATGTVFTLNGNTSGVYSTTGVEGDGTSAVSNRNSNATNAGLTYETTANARQNVTLHFMNYANTSTNKTILRRSNSTSTQVVAAVTLYRSTSAITSITLTSSSGNFNAGATFTLYGIAAA
jgi:hypothetical protein